MCSSYIILGKKILYEKRKKRQSHSDFFRLPFVLLYNTSSERMISAKQTINCLSRDHPKNTKWVLILSTRCSPFTLASLLWSFPANDSNCFLPQLRWRVPELPTPHLLHRNRKNWLKNTLHSQTMSHAEHPFRWMPVQIHSCHALQDNGRHHHCINSSGDILCMDSYLWEESAFKPLARGQEHT